MLYDLQIKALLSTSFNLKVVSNFDAKHLSWIYFLRDVKSNNVIAFEVLSKSIAAKKDELKAL